MAFARIEPPLVHFLAQDIASPLGL